MHFSFQETSILKSKSKFLCGLRGFVLHYEFSGSAETLHQKRSFLLRISSFFVKWRSLFLLIWFFFSKKRLIPWTMELDYEQKYVRISLDICANQLAGGLLLGDLLLKNQKYFEVMLNIFKFSRVWENVESWLLFWIAQPYFSTDLIKRS